MFVGIFGTGRNGSTLLMRLMDSSPGLWVYPLELRFLSDFGYLEKPVSSIALKKALKGSPTRTEATRQQFYQDHFHPWVNAQLLELQASYLDKLVEPIKVKADVHAEIASRVNDSVADNMVTVLEGLQKAFDDRRQATKPLLTFKSIEVRLLERYNRLFPHLRFVHILRDPVTTYESLKRTDMVRKQKPFWFQGGDILRMHIEDRWLPHVRFILKHRLVEPARHYLVRYEDLTKDPVRIVNSICQWLGVEVPTRPGLQTVLGGKMMTELPSNPSKEGVKTPVHVVAKMAEEFGYEDVLTRREREWITLRARSLASQIGYADSPDLAEVPGRFTLLREWLPLDDWERMNAHSGLQIAPYVIRRRFYILSKLLFN